MILSRACEQAIRTILFVAAHAGERPIGVPMMARELGVSSTALSKVVQTLTRHGLLASQKGPGGGVRLARPANKITVLEIVHLIDGRELGHACILGLPGCSEGDSHCPLHDRWKRIRERMLTMLVSPSIAQLAERLKNDSHVLARSARRTSRVVSASLGARGGRR